VQQLVFRLEENSIAFRATQTSEGGLRRPLLRDVLVDLVPQVGRLPAPGIFTPAELDLVLPELRVGLAVQAGRAWTNNGALLSVLAAASEPAVDWLVALVPFAYKSGSAFPNVSVQLSALAIGGGVDLDLHGIGIVAY
jgi:hypothetical protein